MLAAMPLPSVAGTGGGRAGTSPPLSVVDVAQRVRRRSSLVLVSLFVAVVAGGVLSYLTEPVYTARASVLVQPVIAEQFGNVNIGNVLNMATEAQVAQSLGVATAAGEQLGVAPNQVRDALSVDTAQDTEVLNITYRAGTAQAAARGAQTVATSYLSYRESIAAADADRRLVSIADQISSITRRIAAGGQVSGYQDTLRELLADQRELTSIKATSGGRVITEAVPPTSRTAPKPVVNLAAGGIGGVLVGLALAVFWPRRREELSLADLPRSRARASSGASGRPAPSPPPGVGPPSPASVLPRPSGPREARRRHAGPPADSMAPQDADGRWWRRRS